MFFKLFCGTEDQTQGLVHAKHARYHQVPIFFSVLGIKPKASFMLVKCFTIELHTQEFGL
jgi:hypothetical protein